MTIRCLTLLTSLGIAIVAWNVDADDFKLGVGSLSNAAISRLFTFSIETTELEHIRVEQRGGLKMTASSKSTSDAKPQHAAVEVSLKRRDQSCDVRVSISSIANQGDAELHRVLNESSYTVALPRSGLQSLFILAATNGTYKPNEPLTLGTLQGRPLKLTVAVAKHVK